MKTHTIKTPTAELLIVQLPHRTADFSVINTCDRIAISAFDEYDNCLDVMPISTDYTLLGKPAEIREEDAAGLAHFTESNGIYFWKSHDEGRDVCLTATESLLSAIESVIFWENPYKDRKENEDLDEYLHNWQESEICTFDRSRSIILVK